MSQQAEYCIKGRDQTGKPVQVYTTASSIFAARKKAKSISKFHGGTLLSIRKKKNYTYRVRRGNAVMEGLQSAYSRQEVITAMENLGFQVQKVSRYYDYRLQAPMNEIVTFVGTSAKLLEQKLAYNEVLRIMVNNVRDRNLKGALKDIINDLKKGVDSREAFVRQSKVLGEHTALMLGIASKSGDMKSIFESVARLVERQAEFKKGLISSLILPAVTSIALVGAIVFYVMYLLPRMVEMMGSVISSMPPVTAATLEISKLIQDNLTLIVVSILLMMLSFYAYILTSNGRLLLHRFIIRVPYLGRILRNTSAEIFCRVLGIVYTSSGENIDAIRLAAESSGNYYLDRQIKTIGIPLMLKYGTELAQALEQTNFFPEMVISRFRTAGETGDVKGTATQLADYYQMENQYAMKNLLSIIEVSISILIMVSMIFLTLLSSETASMNPLQR